METLPQALRPGNVVAIRPGRVDPVAGPSPSWILDGVTRAVWLSEDRRENDGRVLGVAELAQRFGRYDAALAKSSWHWVDAGTCEPISREAIQGDLVGIEGWRVPLRVAGRLVGRDVTPELLAALGLTPPRQQAAAAIQGPMEGPAVTLNPELFDQWVASIDGSTEDGTRKEYRRIAVVQWAPFFRTLGAIGGKIKAYTNDRLKHVGKPMHLKELSALRGFLAWAEEQGHLVDAPHVPAPPRKATGKPSATRKMAPVSVSEEEIERIIALLPEWTRARRGNDRHRVREVFVLAWETGLRPITIGRLSVPEHWRPGMRSLNIAFDIDKARFGRELPLTPRAVEVLERCAPAAGPVFDHHDYRALLKKAARDAGLDDERAKHFSRYDFRHNRADFLLDQGADLRAVAYNHGHKLLTTTDKYLRPSKKGAEAMLAKVAARPGASSGASSTSGACSCTPDGVLDEMQASDYSAPSTRTWRNWQTHQIQVLAG